MQGQLCVAVKLKAYDSLQPCHGCYILDMKSCHRSIIGMTATKVISEIITLSPMRMLLYSCDATYLGFSSNTDSLYQVQTIAAQKGRSTVKHDAVS